MTPQALAASLLNCSELCRQLRDRADGTVERAASRHHEALHLQHEVSALSASLKVPVSVPRPVVCSTCAPCLDAVVQKLAFDGCTHEIQHAC